MIKTTSTESFPILYILEAAVNPDDIKSTILRENTVETATGEKVKTITTDSTLQSFEILNWNGRIYPGNVVMAGMDSNAKIQNDIRMRQFAGEYGHPDSKEMIRQSIIDPAKTSHYIDNYRKEGNLLRAYVTSAPFGYGFYMYNTAIAGRPWAFSLRAFGGVNSKNVALHPLTIITYDEVNRPSHKEAYGTLDGVVKNDVYTDSFLRECSQTSIFESDTIVNEITNFILDKSDNIKIAKELFGLQESVGEFVNDRVLLEGSYMGTSIKVYTPVESYIRQNYAKLIRI